MGYVHLDWMMLRFTKHLIFVPSVAIKLTCLVDP